MIEKLKNWWKWDPEAEKNSADNPLTALTGIPFKNPSSRTGVFLLSN